MARKKRATKKAPASRKKTTASRKKRPTAKKKTAARKTRPTTKKKKSSARTTTSTRSTSSKKARASTASAKATPAARPARTMTTKTTTASRITVSKTFKMYVGGAFVRSEGGHVLDQHDHEGRFMAHYARATRKDLRDAVGAARKAQPGWAARTPFNRSQILYRLAEMIEDRRAVFSERCRVLLGDSEAEAHAEIDTAIEVVFGYAGWTDKFAQVLGGINPVSAPFFNFTSPDPVGVVAVMPSRQSPLAGLVAAFVPVILSGNTCVVIADNDAPVLACDLGEALATSDFPPGVVNLLTGYRDELRRPISEHMDIGALSIVGADPEEREAWDRAAADNVKRVRYQDERARAAWRSDTTCSPYRIEPFVEWKTAWHPIGT